MNFTEAEKALGKRETKKLDNNTYLYRIDENTLGIKLHNTTIIEINRVQLESGDSVTHYLLRTGGFQTVTTKDRLNKFTPARISQINFIWYFFPSRIAFTEGAVVDETGDLVPVFAEFPKRSSNTKTS